MHAISPSPILGALALLVGAVPAAAQERPLALGRPDAAVVEAFSSVRGVRELPSGQVLLADWIEERVMLVDLDEGTATDVMRRGPGPDEVRLPSALVPMPGDSTLVVDLGNNRLTILGPDGRVARSVRVDRPGMGGVRGVDARGGLWYAVPGWAEQGAALPDDSVRVVRLAPDGTQRTVAVIQGSRMRSDAGSPSREPRIPIVGYAAQDGWTLLGDGSLALVRGADYRVEVIAPGGGRVSGASVAGRPRLVTEADKRRFILDFSAANPTSGRGEGGGMGHTPAPDEAAIARLLRSTQFAEFHPHFTGAPLAAPAGRFWVRRADAASESARYDVFDAQGRRVHTVELPPGRRVLAVGTRGAYAVHTTDLGLETLERYRLPAP